MRELRVLPGRDAGKQKCDNHRSDTYRIHRRFLHPAAEEKHHYGPEGREERNDPDVIKKLHSALSSQQSACPVPVLAEC